MQALMADPQYRERRARWERWNTPEEKQRRRVARLEQAMATIRCADEYYRETHGYQWIEL